MPRVRQLSLLPPTPLSHGGDLRQGKRKVARPIDLKRPIHIVLRSTRARGEWSLLHRRNKARIFLIVHQKAEQFGVKIYRFSNVGNHLHILGRPGSRVGFQNFLRASAGAVAFFVTGAKKGEPLRARFWDLLAFTRVLSWGREFANLKSYFVKNLLEGLNISSGEYILKPLPS